MANLVYDPKTDKINQLKCHPEEWEERCDTYQCEKCGNNFNEVWGWDEDCYDFHYFICPMCGNVVGEE